MRKSKKLLAVFLSTTIALTTFVCSMGATANDNITVTLEGTQIDFDVQPQIIDGRTVVPLRKIFEELGALVKWDSETQTVSARKNSKTVTMTIGSADMQIDKGKTDTDGNPVIETVTLDVSAQVLDGRTLVPARAISEAFGLNVEWDAGTSTVVITDDDEDDARKENTGTINLTDLTYTGEGIEITDNLINITAGGDYTITGTLADGNITVNTTDKVKLRLSGASVTSSTGSCIYFEKADKAYITLTSDTENSLIALDGESDALYSKENLEIKGSGVLNITSKGGHAIKASDNLTIENGVLNLTAEGDGIHINDTFKMTGGKISITANGDGIDSESIVIIEGGVLDIKTNGTPTTTESADTDNGDAIQPNMNFRSFEDEADVEFEKSSKGINAEWMMVISGGDITVSSASHAIHCQDEIEITGGTFSISSAYDKGISAHGNLTVDGEDTVIDITKSTEGMESKNVMTINNGTINIVSSDDAINATGGNSGDMMGGGFGGGQKTQPAERISREGEQGQTGDFVRPGRGQRNEDIQMPFENRQDTSDKQMNGVMPTPPEKGEMPELPENGEMPELPVNGEMPNRPEKGEMTAPSGMEEVQQPNLEDNGNRPQNGGGFGGGMMGGNQKDCLIINGGDIEMIAGDDCLDANGNIIINGGVIKATKVNGSFVGTESVIDPDGRTTINENATIIAAVGSGTSQGSLNLTQNMITVYSDTNYNPGDKIVLTNKNGKVIAEYTPNGTFKAVVIISPDIETGADYTLTVGGESTTLSVTEQNTVIGTPTNWGGFGGRAR